MARKPRSPRVPAAHRCENLEFIFSASSDAHLVDPTLRKSLGFAGRCPQCNRVFLVSMSLPEAAEVYRAIGRNLGSAILAVSPSSSSRH